MPSTVTDDDEGKKVVYDDDTIGRVVEVEDGTVYVDPDPGVTEAVTSKLGWTDADADDVVLHEDSIVDVTDDAVRIDVDTDVDA